MNHEDNNEDRFHEDRNGPEINESQNNATKWPCRLSQTQAPGASPPPNQCTSLEQMHQ